MMIICLGALQGIPTDMYEAADLDGAGAWARFRYLTLPLLLISVGPLLVGAFAFNFNNFTIIELVNEGGPPIPGAYIACWPDRYPDLLYLSSGFCRRARRGLWHGFHDCV
jgi:ABC-type sugar transport system permease subunit